MKRFLTLRPLAAVALAGALAFAGCDASEHNLSWVPGNSLAIGGPFRTASSAPSADGGARGVYTPVYPGNLSQSEVHFFVNNFNSARTYTWTFNGQAMPIDPARGGEVAIASIPADTAPGAYTVQVSNGEITGEMVVNVRRPPLMVQLDRFAQQAGVWSLLYTALGAAAAPAPGTDPATGLTNEERCALAGTNILNSAACTAAAATGPFTLFAPSNAAFLAALDADGDGQVSADELPEAPELAAILRNHVVAGSIRAADITDGMTRTTLGGTQITFRRTGDQITVVLADGTTASVSSPADILAANGVIHSINAVLLSNGDD